ncbi:MAG TPA: hypothetical protein ENN31_01240 [Candidatus Vogelbacteria bacterium]|nr:hypothetical protein [Candidatus Vogelbacteria bacterium]
MKKKKILEAVIDFLCSAIVQNQEILDRTHQSINDAPSAMESGSDTSRFQLSSLAQNQLAAIDKLVEVKHQVEILKETLGSSSATEIKPGSIIEVEVNEKVLLYLILPCEGIGGMEVEWNSHIYVMISDGSPFINALKGCHKGDELSIVMGGHIKKVKVLDVY